MRIGLGFDVHRLTEGDGVILGGVKISFHKKLVGHSDADALTHAVIDALLGAAALGDIGQHFPDTDPRFKGIPSIKLLKKTVEMISAGFTIRNIDAVVIAEAPKIAPHRAAIAVALSETLGIQASQVSVKGKTAEGLGAIGAGEALSAYAVALLEEIS